MARLRAAIAVALAVAWPLALQAAVLVGRPGLMPAITGAFACAFALIAALAARSRLAGLLAIAIGAITVFAYAVAPALLLFLPPAAINVVLGTTFGASLRSGREPVISTFARLERGNLEPGISAYTRVLTWIWTWVFFVQAAVGLILAVAAPLVVWSTFTNVVSYCLVAALFCGEYVYRRFRFPQYEHATLPELVRIVARSGFASRREH